MVRDYLLKFLAEICSKYRLCRKNANKHVSKQYADVNESLEMMKTSNVVYP